MNFKTKLQINLYKAYFDKGLQLTSYAKYLIAFFALASLNVNLTLIIGFIYAVLCLILGFYWYKSDFIKAEIEVGNRYNLFVNEVRQKLKKTKSFK